MKFSLNALLTLVSLTAAGVAAFYSWKLIDQTNIAAIRDQVESKLSKDSFEGAVVAFDLIDGCPEGWVEFPRAQSRSIIGAHFANESVDPDLKKFSHDSTGGQETIQLTLEQLASHNHAYMDTYYSEDVKQLKERMEDFEEYVKIIKVPGKVGPQTKTDSDNEGWQLPSETEHAGKGEAIPVRSPFIALYYCRRNEQ